MSYWNKPVTEINIDQHTTGLAAKDFFSSAYESDYRVQQVIEDAERKYHLEQQRRTELE